MSHPRDDLVRATWPGAEVRSAETDEGLGRMVGHFSVFGDWYKVDSHVEGRFMERVMPGAFEATIADDRASMVVLLNHGRDPQVGDKPLGTITSLAEDDRGAAFEVELLDAAYVRDDILPGLKAGLYGSSMRFSVLDDAWDDSPHKGDHNPEALAERTITRASVREFGPVTFPASPGASAGVRSLTDRFRAGKPTEPVAPAEPGPAPKESTTMAEPEYITRDEKAARMRDIEADLKQIAADNDGVLPSEIQTRWDVETQELDKLGRDISALDERRAKLRTFAEDGKHDEPVTPPTIIRRKTEDDLYDLRAYSNLAPEKRGQALRDGAMRVAEEVRTPSDRYDQDKSREKIQSLVEYNDGPDNEISRRVITTNAPAYRDAFNRYVGTGGSERAAALAVGADATGGFAVPVAFDPTILAVGAWTAVNPYRQACRVETISGTDTWQALTATAVAATYAAEAAAATEAGPTFTRPEFIAKRAHSFVTISYEMAQDRPGLPAELGKLFGEGKDNLEEAQFTLGAGSTVYPEGIALVASLTPKDTITNDVTAVADVLALEADLPIRHRVNAAWFLSRAGIRAIQAWETTGGQLFNATVGYPAVGNPVMAPAGNTGMTLLGYPIYETPSMPWTPTGDGTIWGVLIDPSAYVIVDRIGMSVKVIPDMLNGATPSFPTGEIGVYAFWRNTARVLNVDAGRQGTVQ